jgi:hypothetical protein
MPLAQAGTREGFGAVVADRHRRLQDRRGRHAQQERGRFQAQAARVAANGLAHHRIEAALEVVDAQAGLRGDRLDRDDGLGR